MAKQIAPENVVGRDRLIAQLWKTIERESVVFTAERRIGKTTVMKKMEAEPVAGSGVPRFGRRWTKEMAGVSSGDGTNRHRQRIDGIDRSALCWRLFRIPTRRVACSLAKIRCGTRRAFDSARCVRQLDPSHQNRR